MICTTVASINAKRDRPYETQPDEAAAHRTVSFRHRSWRLRIGAYDLALWRSRPARLNGCNFTGRGDRCAKRVGRRACQHFDDL